MRNWSDWGKDLPSLPFKSHKVINLISTDPLGSPEPYANMSLDFTSRPATDPTVKTLNVSSQPAKVSTSSTEHAKCDSSLLIMFLNGFISILYYVLCRVWLPMALMVELMRNLWFWETKVKHIFHRFTRCMTGHTKQNGTCTGCCVLCLVWRMLGFLLVFFVCLFRVFLCAIIFFMNTKNCFLYNVFQMWTHELEFYLPE